MKKLWFLSLALFYCIQPMADIAIVVGWGQTTDVGCNAPVYPVANFLKADQQFAPSFSMPDVLGEILTVATDPNSGEILFAGALGTRADRPFIYKGNVFSSEVQTVKLPKNTSPGYIQCSAFDSKGTAILAGQNTDASATPSIFKLKAGSKKAKQILLPSSNAGQLYAVAFFPDNTAILVGQDGVTSAPLIYLLPEGATQAISVSIPDPSIAGILQCIAVSSDGSAILAGQDLTNNQALIYRLKQGKLSAKTVKLPVFNDGGIVYATAMTSYGTAILAGSINARPLLYKIHKGADQATIIHTDENGGTLYSVSIGADDIAIAGGNTFTNTGPYICKIEPHSSSAHSVHVPSSFSGEVISISIGEENIATIAGATETNVPFILRMATKDHTAHSVPFALSWPEGVFGAVVTYSYHGIYDMQRLKPYYYLDVEKTKKILNQAGLQ